jgi:hypothetical protein
MLPILLVSTANFTDDQTVNLLKIFFMPMEHKDLKVNHESPSSFVLQVQELEKECQKALERASMAEDVLRKRDAENARLKERLRCLDEEGVRLDSDLHASLTLLQSEKDSALDEGRVLLAQVTHSLACRTCVESTVGIL